MEQNVKMVVGGVALFILGGLSVYFFTSRHNAVISPATAQQVQTATLTSAAPTTAQGTNTAPSITDAESFYEAAEARREQQLADKAEADRLAKLKAIKERSVECKFWKQQQKTSSAAAKIEEKIIQYCTLQTTSSSASSENSSSTTENESISSSVAE